MPSSLILFSYFRSSASYRVRIALHLKNVPFEYKPVHLLRSGGEQYSLEYKHQNPQGEVPCLVTPHGPLSQSMAILDWLDASYPEPQLFPSEAFDHSLVIQMCEAINAGIQPLQNLKVLHHLESKFGASKEQKAEWIRRWVEPGLTAFHKLVEKHGKGFCFGKSLTAADCYLIPQLFASRRFEVDLQPYPKLLEVEATCLQMEAFKKAHPSAQCDFEA